MANIALREDVTIAWIYLAKCYPKNLPQFSLSLYLYIGQTLRPDIRSEQHMIEDKSNPKFEQLRSLTTVDDWEFVFLPVLKRFGENFKNYMNRTGIDEKQQIREFETNYFRYGWDTYGLNASDGGEHPSNGGYRTYIPGETTGLKHCSYKKKRKVYIYGKNTWENGQYICRSEFFSNKNPFLVFLYMEVNGEKDFIVDEKKFWNNVWKYWTQEIYNSQCTGNFGIKSVSVLYSTKVRYNCVIRYRKNTKKEKITCNRVSFVSFLELYRDGVLPIEDIYNLDFYIWNAKLVYEGNFDIKNGRPLLFYDDFLKFRKIHHFTVDDLQPAIDFLKEIEECTKFYLPKGQQQLQCT